MESRRFWGIIIIIILIAAFCTAVYATAFKFGMDQSKEVKKITNNYTLTDAQLAGVNYVNFNFNGNTTGVDVSFQNKSDSLYDISVERNNNSKEPNLTYSQQGDVLNVNMNLDSGSAKVVMGNRCTYNGTLQTRLGGFSMRLNNNSKVDTINSTIKYLGGGFLALGDTSFKNLNLNVNAGGFMIQSLKSGPQTSGTISTNVQMGGTTIQIRKNDSVGYKIAGTVDFGGIAFDPANFDIIQNQTNLVELNTPSYQDKPVKININNTVGLGGLNINMFMTFIPTPEQMMRT
jgi:hypothetical protein